MEAAAEGTHRRDIDGLRAVAVLAVVAYHAAPAAAPGGFVGVDVFFVISGFLITGLIAQRREAGTFTLSDFYARRVRRLLPALLLVLAACAVVGAIGLTGDELRALGRMVVASAGFVPNVVLWRDAGYFAPSAIRQPLLHLWSLGVEEQFYALWPLLLTTLWPRRAARLGAAVAVAALSFAVGTARMGAHPNEVFYMPHGRMWEPMLGAILALWAPGAPARPRIREAVSLAGLAVIAAAVFGLDTATPFPGPWAVLPTLGAALVIAAGPDAWLNRAVLSRPALTGIGLVSYPLYLWHWPLLSFASTLGPVPTPPALTALVLALAAVLSASTWWAVERPVRTLWSRRPETVPSLVALTAVMAGVGGAAWLGVLPAGDVAVELRVDHQRALDDASGSRYAVAPCHDARVGPRVAPFCFEGGDTRSPHLLVVWGDCHAKLWSPAFYAIGEERHLHVVVIGTGGCPAIAGARNVDGPRGASSECIEKSFGEEVMATLRALSPERVYLVTRWSLYADGHYVDGKLSRDTHFLSLADSGPGDRASSRAAITQALPDTVRRLRAFTDVSILRSWPLLQTSLERGLSGALPFEPTVAEHRAKEAFPDAILDAIHAADPAVRVIDPSVVVCGLRCRVIVDGTIMFRDDNHPTTTATMIAKDVLVQGL